MPASSIVKHQTLRPHHQLSGPLHDEQLGGQTHKKNCHMHT